jgi:hypothetical protein
MKIYKISGINVSREEKVRIEDFVKDIKNGYHNWNDEDIQLYQNNSKIIEALLRGEEVDWGINKEEELHGMLKELKSMLGIK